MDQPAQNSRHAAPDAAASYPPHRDKIGQVRAELRRCTHCAAHLPLGPRPIFQIGSQARVLIASQAPGTRAHASGQTFDDRSGDRLRDWLGVTRPKFYDPDRFAIVPMGLCYPGRGTSGDAPPRPECAPLWRARIQAVLPQIRLVLLVGSHAQNHYLGRGRMTDRVQDFRDCRPGFFPLPHPSWRTTGWMQRNPWFAQEVLPALKDRVHSVLSGARDADPVLFPPMTGRP